MKSISVKLLLATMFLCVSASSASAQGRYPIASNRLLSPDDFIGLDKNELKIMRNEIFARYGYIFKTEDMKAYFGRQPWYQPKMADVSKFITPVEKKNLELIKRMEDGNIALPLSKKTGSVDKPTNPKATGSRENSWVTSISSSSDNDIGRTVIATADGHIAIVGTVGYRDYEDIIVAKLDHNGNLLWKRVIGGSSSDIGYSLVATNDGGLVIVGQTSSNDRDFSGMQHQSGFVIQDAFVIKLDLAGTIVWKKTIGGEGSDVAYSIAVNANGDIVITGKTQSDFGDFYNMKRTGISDVFIVKLDSKGDVLWKKLLGSSQVDVGYSIASSTDGKTGITGSFGYSDFDFNGLANGHGSGIFFIKIEENGNVVVRKSIAGFDDEEGYSICSNHVGGYVLTGYTESNEIIGKTNKGRKDVVIAGIALHDQIAWVTTIGSTGDDIGKAIVATDDGGTVLIGSYGARDADFSQLLQYSGSFIAKCNSTGTPQWVRILPVNAQSIAQTKDGGFVITGNQYSDGKHGIRGLVVMKLDREGKMSGMRK